MSTKAFAAQTFAWLRLLKADHDTTGKDYFVHEMVYGTFERSFRLPEGVDAAQVEAKYASGILEVKVPAPRVATPMVIEVKAA